MSLTIPISNKYNKKSIEDLRKALDFKKPELFFNFAV